jgi:hypothetical protein
MTRDAEFTLFGEHQDVSLPLMRTLRMKVRNVLFKAAPQRGLAEQNELGKTVLRQQGAGAIMRRFVGSDYEVRRRATSVRFFPPLHLHRSWAVLREWRSGC